MTGKKKDRKQLSLIQVARALGILLVVIGHVNLIFYDKFRYDWFNMGQWERSGGVDFFFVVTGFLIYYIYHSKIGIPGRTKDFLLKRFIRIFPLYWLFTFILIATSLFYPSLHESYSWTLVIKSFLLLPDEPILSSAWSLSHVVFFYLLFSLLLFKPKFFKPVIAVWIFTTIVIELKIFSQWESFLFSFSTLEIVFGCIVAYITLRTKIKYSSIILVIGLSGYLMIWINNVLQSFSVHEPLLYCLFSLLIVLGIAIKDTGEIKIPKILAFLGNASYSVYISHGPFLILYVLLFAEPLIRHIGHFMTTIFILLLTILSACIVYVGIERPLSKYLKDIIFHGSKASKLEPAVIQVRKRIV